MGITQSLPDSDDKKSNTVESGGYQLDVQSNQENADTYPPFDLDNMEDDSSNALLGAVVFYTKPCNAIQGTQQKILASDPTTPKTGDVVPFHVGIIGGEDDFYDFTGDSFGCKPCSKIKKYQPIIFRFPSKKHRSRITRITTTAYENYCENEATGFNLMGLLISFTNTAHMWKKKEDNKKMFCGEFVASVLNQALHDVPKKLDPLKMLPNRLYAEMLKWEQEPNPIIERIIQREPSQQPLKMTIK